MQFNQSELNMTKGLTDAFIDILVSDQNYIYSEELKQKAYKFIVHLVWQRKKKLRGGELTTEEFQDFTKAIFYMILTSETFLNEFDNFNIEYSEENAIIKPVEAINQSNTSKYLS